jgi:hypothetical protein
LPKDDTPDLSVLEWPDTKITDRDSIGDLGKGTGEVSGREIQPLAHKRRTITECHIPHILQSWAGEMTNIDLWLYAWCARPADEYAGSRKAYHRKIKRVLRRR